jgi:hypothetical protein
MMADLVYADHRLDLLAQAAHTINEGPATLTLNKSLYWSSYWIMSQLRAPAALAYSAKHKHMNMPGGGQSQQKHGTTSELCHVSLKISA